MRDVGVLKYLEVISRSKTLRKICDFECLLSDEFTIPLKRLPVDICAKMFSSDFMIQVWA